MSSDDPERAPGREATQATREALIDAALAEFAEHGFDAPSLDAICARAGYTRGAFYVHFRDREDLVVAVVSRVVERFLDAVLAGGEGAADLPGAVRRFADTIAAATASHGRHEPLVAAGLLPLHRILEAARRSPAIRSRLVVIAGEARDRVAAAARLARTAGALRDDVDPVHLAALLVALALGVLIGAEVGVPIELVALQETLGALVAPPAGRPPRRRAAPSLSGAGRRSPRRR